MATPSGSAYASIFAGVRHATPYPWHAAFFDKSPVRTRRWALVDINTAVFVYRWGYPAARCISQPAFTVHGQSLAEARQHHWPVEERASRFQSAKRSTADRPRRYALDAGQIHVLEEMAC